MPGLVIDNVGGGEGQDAIIKTLEVPKDQLTALNEEAVLEWLNTWGFEKGTAETIKVITVDRKPVNPSVIIIDREILETEVVELNLMDSQGRPIRDVLDFRLDGEHPYYKIALLEKSQWPEGAFNQLVHFPVDWQSLYSKFSAQIMAENKDGKTYWHYVEPELVIRDGRLDVIFDIDKTQGVPGDGRAINIGYLLKNPAAKFKKIKTVDAEGNPYPINGITIYNHEDRYNPIASSWSGGAEAFVYLPEGINLHVKNVYTGSMGDTGLYGHDSQYMYDYQDPEGSKIPFDVLEQDEIEIEVDEETTWRSNF